MIEITYSRVCHMLTKPYMLLNNTQSLYYSISDYCNTISVNLWPSEHHLCLIIKLQTTSVWHYWKVEISAQTQSHSHSYTTVNFKWGRLQSLNWSFVTTRGPQSWFIIYKQSPSMACFCLTAQWETGGETETGANSDEVSRGLSRDWFSFFFFFF